MDCDSDDLVERPISQIQVGDIVMNKDRTSKNKVLFIETHESGMKNRYADLYSPNESIPPFASTNHPLFVDGEWVAVDVDLYPWLEKQRPLRDVKTESSGERKLYNLWVSGDGTYIVNGFGTHSIMFDGGYIQNAYTQGLLDHGEVMRWMKDYTIRNDGLLLGSFIANRLVGKFNFKLLNKLVLYFMNGDDQSKRKKIMHWLMKFLQNRYGK